MDPVTLIVLVVGIGIGAMLGIYLENKTAIKDEE